MYSVCQGGWGGAQMPRVRIRGTYVSQVGIVLASCRQLIFVGSYPAIRVRILAYCVLQGGGVYNVPGRPCIYMGRLCLTGVASQNFRAVGATGTGDALDTPLPG